MSQCYNGLISIAGVIGVGKTTLADNLAAALGGNVIREKYDENPFLARQFSGCGHSALPSELFFLLTRAQQLAVEYFDTHQLYISDYIFEKNRFFADMSLDRRQMDIYNEVEGSVELIINKPDLVIYLYDSVENCHQRILSRGREFERSISLDFLEKLLLRYEQLFENWQKCPVLKLNCSEYDLRSIDDIQAVKAEVVELLVNK